MPEPFRTSNLIGLNLISGVDAARNFRQLRRVQHVFEDGESIDRYLFEIAIEIGGNAG